jgi:hypothetical protein
MFKLHGFLAVLNLIPNSLRPLASSRLNKPELYLYQAQAAPKEALLGQGSLDTNGQKSGKLIRTDTLRNWMSDFDGR